MNIKDITIGMKVLVTPIKDKSRNQRFFNGVVTQKYIAKTSNYKEKKADKITNQKTKFENIELVTVLDDKSNIEYDCEASQIDKIK